MKRTVAPALAAILFGMPLPAAATSTTLPFPGKAIIATEVTSPGKVVITCRYSATQPNLNVQYELLSLKESPKNSAKTRQTGSFQTETTERHDLCKTAFNLGEQDNLNISLKFFYNQAVVSEEHVTIHGADLILATPDTET